MATLFRRTYKVKNPETGAVEKRPYKNWWIKYKDADGKLRRVAGYTDRAATLQKAAKLERQAMLGKSGLRDPFAEQRARPLVQHLEDFRKTLLARGATEKHVKSTHGEATRLCKACRFYKTTDLAPSRVERYLGELRIKGRSPRTRNSYLQSIKQFSRWLVDDRRAPDDPLACLKRANEAVDKRRTRRALTADEFAKLLDSASHGPVVEGMKGRDRAVLYLVAAFTGLRRKEMGSLTRSSFDLESDPATVTVEAGYSKRRRRDTIPLHPAVASRVCEWLIESPVRNGSLLFPVAERKTSKMMRLDLERAGVPYVDAEGRVADFHANRHTFITNLCRAGVAPKVAQSLARHSTITLTMDVYSHADSGERIEAVRSLPAPS